MMQLSDSPQRKQFLIVFNKSCIFQEIQALEQPCSGNLVFISEQGPLWGVCVFATTCGEEEIDR